MMWFAKRVARSLFTILVVIHLSFVVIHYLPGGPLTYLRSQLETSGVTVGEAQMQAMAQSYLNMNPEEGLVTSYLDYMSSLLQGNLGRSISTGDPVIEILAQAIPWTVFLMFTAITISFTVGIALGSLMAYLEGSRFDSVATVVSICLNSVPYYLIGILLVYILGYIYGVFPISGKYAGTKVTAGLNLPFIMSVLYHATLPVFSWALYGFGGWALAMRGNSIRVLGEGYMRVGRLRGLPTHRLAINYVGRNAILPLYTNILIIIGSAFGGAVVLETIFVYRGMGYFLLQAVRANDYPLMMGSFILIVTAVMAALLFAELTYGKLDPRAQEGGANNEAY